MAKVKCGHFMKYDAESGEWMIFIGDFTFAYHYVESFTLMGFRCF